MSIARRERVDLCRLLRERGPDAPTLCVGWRTADLAAHLWTREHDPLAAPGLVLAALAPVTRWRMRICRQRFSYADLVDRLERPPRAPSPLALSGVDAALNTAEFFVHHEDVRRAGDAPAEARHLAASDEDTLWRATLRMAPLLLRGLDVGIVLERADRPQVRVHVRRGARVVTAAGLPSELLLFVFGRRGVSRVRLIGEPDALARLDGAGGL